MKPQAGRARSLPAGPWTGHSSPAASLGTTQTFCQRSPAERSRAAALARQQLCRGCQGPSNQVLKPWLLAPRKRGRKEKAQSLHALNLNLFSFSSSPASQHPQCFPLKEGSRKLGVFVVSAGSAASAGDAGSSLQQGTRGTSAAATPPLLQPSAPRVCSWAPLARRGQRVTWAGGYDQ